MAKHKAPALVRATKLPRIRIDPRAIAIPKAIRAKCAVPLGDGRVAAAGYGSVELYGAKAKQLASIECKDVQVVAAVHGGRVIVASTLGGDLVVFGIVGDALDELVRLKAKINCYTLTTAGDRVFVSRKTGGELELVGLIPAYAGFAATQEREEPPLSSGPITLAPIAARDVPEADEFDPTEIDWSARSGRGGDRRPDAIAVRPDAKAAVVLDPTELWWAPARGKGRSIAEIERCGSIVGAEFVGPDAIVVLASERLHRFAVTEKSAKLTAKLEVEFGAALAVRRDRRYVIALVIDVGDKHGKVFVFDALLRQLAVFEKLASIRAAGGRLFASDAKSRAFEITGLI